MFLPDFTESLHMTFSRSKDLVLSDSSDEIITLQLKNGKDLILTGIGSLLWKHIEQPASFCSSVNAILLEFNLDRQRCEEEIRNLLHQMNLIGLIEIHSDLLD